MILVTGATGHLGNVLVRKLSEQGEVVRALVLAGESCEPLKGLDVEIVEGDVTDMDSLERAMDGVELVYHLAGVISIVPGADWLMTRVNVEGARNVALTALKSGVKRMVHTSSVHAFKREPHGTVMDEETPLDPENPAGAYDRSKARGTIEVLKIAEKGLDVVVVCPAGIIGPYDFQNSEMGNVVLNFAKRKLHFLIRGGFDFVDVRDVAEGVILAAEKGKSGEVYILSGERIAMTEIRNLAQNAAGIKSPLLKIPIKTAMIAARIAGIFYSLTGATPIFTTYSLQTLLHNSCYSNKKACRELGYKTRSLQESIADSISWRRGLSKAAY